MKLHDVMTPNAECIGLRDTLAAAMAMMRSSGATALPVYDHGQPVGLLT